MAFMHPRFRHTFYTLAVYDVRSASRLCSYKAHEDARERRFLRTHDSAPSDIKSRRRCWYGHSAFNELTRARPLGVSPNAYGIN